MRVVNRVLALIVALALIALAVIVVVEVVQAGRHVEPALIDWRGTYRDGGRNPWSATGVRVIAILVGVVGLILTLLQLRPRRPQGYLGGDAAGETEVSVSRGGVTSALRSAVTDVDGVSGASVRLRRHRAKVDVTTLAADPQTAAGLRGQAQQAVDRRLSELDLRNPPSVQLRVLDRGGSQ